MSDTPEKPILLIAEDEAQVMTLLKRFLSAHYDIRGFDSGEKTLDALKAIGRPVVLLTDNGLAGSMTGFALIEQARALHPTIPAVMLSANVSPEGQQQLQAWDVPLIKKPFALDEMKGIIAIAQRKLDGPKSPIDHAARPPKGVQKGLFD